MPRNEPPPQDKLPAGMYRRGRAFYARSRDAAGKVVRRSLGTDLDKALAEFAKLESRRVPTSFAALVQTWLDRHDLRSRPATIKDSRGSAKRLLAEFEGLDARELSEAQIRAFVLKRRSEVSIEACNKDLRALRAILRLAVRQKQIPALPCHLEMLPSPLKKRIPQAISRADFQRLLETADRLDLQESHPMRGPILRLGYFTGLRHQELLHLDWADVDFENLLVRVRAKPAEDFIPKSHSERDVPIPPWFAGYLSDYRQKLPRREERDPVFQPTRRLPRSGHPHRWYDVCHPVREVFEEAKLAGPGRPVGLHALRHSYCTNLVRAGADIEQVRALAGHSSIAVTQRYFWSDSESRRAAAAAMFRMVGDHS